MGCISFSRSAVPPGIKLLRRLRSKDFSFESYRTSVLLLTFMAYTLYHASRKPASIVKDVLQSDSTSNFFMHNSFSTWPHPGYPSNPIEEFLHRPPLLDGRPHDGEALLQFSGRQGSIFMQPRVPSDTTPPRFLESPQGLEGITLKNGDVNTVHVKGWAPFNTTSGTALLGEVDVAFLASYAIGMYFAGHLGDRLCNRWFLTVGMIGSGLCVSLFGNWLAISCYCCRQMVWEKEKRPCHGYLECPYVGREYPRVSNWLLYVEIWVGLGLYRAGERGSRKHSVLEEHAVDSEQGFKSQPLLSNGETSETHEDAVGFFKAWTIPGVVPFAFCLFFTKLVAYTFLYWLPFYIRHTAIQGQYLSDSMSGNMSTVFDIGGVFGGILAGYFSDKMRARAITAASFMYLSIPALLIYNTFGSLSLWLNLVLMFVVGMLVNGPYALITTAVSADLGTHKSLKGNSKALATVTAIIDGLLLSKLVSAEVRDLMARAKAASGEN
ncbi:hypothetical protein GOP47_0022972 [Adiantum capillus-veneris]|uniref:Major facilitator superfamily (MFS) profile domain-containing protein n=1 Tax=Adiantum capillus-veneris TaxID=13818 RepID=A0A9D4U7H8_ADICA|nr:hypothetical protein GOP47_0022972 [Adiantum capillus-veneris]